MKVLEDVCEVLEAELREIVRTGDMSPTVLDNTYKAVDIIKDIKTIEAMENSSYGNSYGNSYMDDDYSMARNNRNTSRNYGMSRYSRADEKEQLMNEMESMKRRLEQMQR